MRTKSTIYAAVIAAAVGAVTVLPTSSAWAHGGGSGVDLDVCRIPVDNHWVHFTAYQPTLSGAQEFCKEIPSIGQATIVFDYESRALRDMTVEFEVTKEPEGTRIFHHDPTRVPTGTLNAQINFPEKSKYLVHVTLINEGKKVDAHVPLTVGAGTGGGSRVNTILYVVVGLMVAGTALFMFKDKLGSKPAA